LEIRQNLEKILFRYICCKGLKYIFCKFKVTVLTVIITLYMEGRREGREKWRERKNRGKEKKKERNLCN
jgi:hypothetical protein